MYDVLYSIIDFMDTRWVKKNGTLAYKLFFSAKENKVSKPEDVDDEIW